MDLAERGYGARPRGKVEGYGILDRDGPMVGELTPGEPRQLPGPSEAICIIRFPGSRHQIPHHERVSNTL